MIDGPGSVSTLILVVARGTEEDGDEVLLPEEELARLNVDVTEGDGERDKEVEGDDGERNGMEDKDKVEDEGAADALATARRMKTVEGHMDVMWGRPVDQLGRTGKRLDNQAENQKEELYRLATRPVRRLEGAWRRVLVAHSETLRNTRSRAESSKHGMGSNAT